MALTLAEREEGNGVSTRKREENLVLLRKWARSWPTEENVRACMPLAWGKERRDKLPADEKGEFIIFDLSCFFHLSRDMVLGGRFFGILRGRGSVVRFALLGPSY